MDTYLCSKIILKMGYILTSGHWLPVVSRKGNEMMGWLLQLYF